MSKKIPKLIVYGLTTIPIITVLACGETVFISTKDKAKLANEKSKQKDVITKIISPIKNDAKYVASLFNAIALARTNANKQINNAKTIADAIKVGKDGVIALNKAIQNYNNSQTDEYKLLQEDKAKFSSFKHLIIGKAIPILKDGSTTVEKLEELTGHDKMPSTTEGVIRTFAIKTDIATKIATITITFTIGTLTDTTTYKIAGFQTINIDVENGFIYQTKEGVIYVGTKNGLKKFVDDELVVVNVANFSWGFMYQTKEGIIYVGTTNAGLKKLEGNELVEVDATNVSGGFMYQTKEGVIYVGTYNKGLAKLEEDTLKIIDSTNVIYGFMLETQEDTIYVGTYEKGFAKLENNELKIVDKIDVYKGFMYQTKEGVIYVGTFRKGLKKFDNNILTSVSGISVWNGFMYQTQEGTIYLGTNNKGLKKLEDDKLLDFYSVDIGGNNFMLETKEGSIYIAIGNSLKKFPKFNL